MKYILPLISILLSSTVLLAQEKELNLDKGFVTSGYDVVAYFDEGAVKGCCGHEYEYNGAKYKFSSEKNLATFKADPDRYVPAYGGWCAYAMAKNGSLVDIDPKTFEIRDGRLFLFYNKYFTNTLEKWLEEEPDQLVKQADGHWAK